MSGGREGEFKLALEGADNAIYLIRGNFDEGKTPIKPIGDDHALDCLWVSDQSLRIDSSFAETVPTSIGAPLIKRKGLLFK